MDPVKRKKLFFGLAIGAMLLLIALGMILTFMQGLDRTKFFVDIQPYWCILPFCVAFPIYIAFEYFLSAKYQNDGFLFGFRGEKHDHIVTVSFFAAVISLLGGGILTFTLAPSIDISWSCFIESLISAAPMIVYLCLSLFYASKENAPISHILALCGYLGALSLIELAVFLLSYFLHPGYLLFYALLPLLCIVMAAVTPSSPSQPSEELE